MALLIDSSIQVEEVGGQSIPGIVPAAALVMILVGVLALAGPARRAVRIDPAEALRTNQQTSLRLLRSGLRSSILVIVSNDTAS